MATHSTILAWKSPWTEEPGRLQSIGSEWDTTVRMRARACVHTCAGTHTRAHTLLGCLVEENRSRLTIHPQVLIPSRLIFQSPRAGRQSLWRLPLPSLKWNGHQRCCLAPWQHTRGIVCGLWTWPLLTGCHPHPLFKFHRPDTLEPGLQSLSNIYTWILNLSSYLKRNSTN